MNSLFQDVVGALIGIVSQLHIPMLQWLSAPLKYDHCDSICEKSGQPQFLQQVIIAYIMPGKLVCVELVSRTLHSSALPLLTVLQVCAVCQASHLLGCTFCLEQFAF